MNALPCTIYVSFAGALLALAAGSRSNSAARWIALLTAVTSFGLTLFAAASFVPGPGLQTIVDVPWIGELGIRYHLAADGISLTLLVLTGLAATAGVLFSWNIEHRVGEFFALYLALIGGVFGVFLSADAFTFFVFYEIAIVPKYFLIANWGSPATREHAAMKLVLYSFAGSALVLAGLLWAQAVAVIHGAPPSFALGDLAAAATHFSHGEQLGMFALVFTGFAVLAGMFPFHTWAPTGHVAAPTAASMLLAGVVMKLGAYGCLRVAMPLFPAGLAFWAPTIATLAIIGILYAGFIALVQDDFKFVIGYSSVSHMGFVLLGLAATNATAVAGAVLQMFSHGVIAGLLFAVVGRMVYERTHTRKLAELRLLPLYRLLPFAALTFVLAGLASMGMPGFSGFPAELTILIGTWKTSPLWAAFAAVGVLAAAAFTLRAIQVSFFGTTGRSAAPVDSHDGAHAHAYEPITIAEKAGASLLIAATLYIGLKPDVLLDWITPALQSPLMQAALKGGAL
ncbi:MAG: NADH-quinone oxidoreductase subunit M [Verrucomicrobia bacterium]|nr:NADH-quinone oxidoreductase subunit M [Verrucomicrobiota bacterium]